MARKQISGLTQKPNGIWYIDKWYKGKRILESTGTSEREEAETFLIHRLEQLRQESVYGVRRIRFWREAATKYLEDFSHQRSIWLTATYLEQLDPFIGHIRIDHIDDDTLAPYVDFMKSERDVRLKNGKTRIAKPAANRTVNIALERVIRILNLCAKKWRDDNKKSWIDSVPSITKLNEKETERPPYPMSWEEQTIFFAELPDHLKPMALFKVNSGTREQEVCKLEWDWEIAVPELNSTVFLIPSDFGGRSEKSGVKNGDERLVVLNAVAKSVIEGQRKIRNSDPDAEGAHLVFPYEGRALHRMNDTAWDNARKRAAAKWKEKHGANAHPGYEHLRVHDMKHTFGRRLRAAGVSFEDRQILLGHKTGSVTSHYSAAELHNLIEAANKVTATDSRSPTLTILKRKFA